MRHAHHVVLIALMKALLERRRLVQYKICESVRIDLFQKGVAIILRVTRDDSWLAKAVANTYSILTLGFLVSIVCEFWKCQ